MVRLGAGTRPRNYSRRPLRFSTAFMPKNISARWERLFMGAATEGQQWIEARYDELDEGRLKSLKGCVTTPASTERRENVSTTSGRIDGACDIPSFTNKVSAPRPA